MYIPVHTIYIKVTGSFCENMHNVCSDVQLLLVNGGSVIFKLFRRIKEHS